MRKKTVLVLAAVTAVCMLGTDAMAQRGGRPGGGGFGGFGGGVLDLAAREDVQDHLELLPDQVDELKNLADSQRERMRSLFSGFRQNASETDQTAAREKIQKTLQEAATETQKKLDAILLPHQAKRLSQLAMQRRLRGGVSNAFGNEELSTQLGISDSQREELQAKAAKAEEEFRAQVAKLREAMQADLLKALSPAQQAKYNDLVGKPFEFAPDERGGFGQGGPGGQPGFGGRPGGGRPGGATGRTRGQRPGQ